MESTGAASRDPGTGRAHRLSMAYTTARSPSYPDWNVATQLESQLTAELDLAAAMDCGHLPFPHL